MTLLDQAIGYFSPLRGARRAQARQLIEALGSFDAAKKGRRTEGWTTWGSDADAASSPALPDLRNRARDLVRNNPYAASALDIYVSETIGAGIVAEISNRQLRAYWDAFVENSDPDGENDFYGQQAVAARCRSESGEVLLQFVEPELTPAEIKGGRFPLQLRVKEPDYIDTSRDGRVPGGAGTIRHGIQYDAQNRKVGYWLFDEHPGAAASWGSIRALGLQSRFVPASQIIHLYRSQRAGQSRGITDFAPVVLRLRELDDYDDAEVMRAKVNACLAAFVTQPAGAGSPIGPISTDDESRIETLYPGLIEYLKPGEGIEFSEPKSSGGYADFERFSLRAIATGYGVPYELMTGDLSQVNYSSYRAGLIRFRRRLEQDQRRLYVPRLCNPVMARFRAIASLLAGKPELGARAKVEWTPPRFELVDPLKETQAEIQAVQAGFEDYGEVVRRRGRGQVDALDSLEAWQKDLTRRGITITSDARTQVSQPAPAEPEPSPKPEDDEDDEREVA